jgi:hypothetical protein
MKYKVKVRYSYPCVFFNWAPHYEGVLESGGIAPRIIDIGSRWRWVVSFTPRPLYPQGKSPLYPLDRRLGGPQSRSGRGGEEKNSQHIPGLEPPIIQPVAQRYTTELSRLPKLNIAPFNSFLIFVFIWFDLLKYIQSYFLAV